MATVKFYIENETKDSSSLIASLIILLDLQLDWNSIICMKRQKILAYKSWIMNSPKNNINILTETHECEAWTIASKPYPFPLTD